jgi:hypothetical protein
LKVVEKGEGEWRLFNWLTFEDGGMAGFRPWQYWSN